MHRANMMFAGFLCALVVIVPIVVWIQALLLRAAVRLTNAILEAAAPPGPAGYDAFGQPQPDSGRAIPVPDLSRAMVIMFAVLAAYFPTRAVTYLVLTLSAKGGMEAVHQGKWVNFLDLSTRAMVANLVSVVVQISMFSFLLPTSFGRACLVMVFEWLIVVGIAFLLMLAIYVSRVPIPTQLAR
jgi:hypothetical protein